MTFDTEAGWVLGALGASTAAMLYYVKLRLPSRLDERMRESMKAFSTAIELRFPSHEGMSMRVVNLSLAVGKKLKFSKQQMRDLEMAARLRELGLCAIPYRLINQKPLWQWTSTDRGTYERFPEVSATMLEVVPSLAHLAPIVRSQNASYDGSSGPYFPSKDSLPIESRVLKVVADFVLFERRQGTLLARETLRLESGTTYDPEITPMFLGLVAAAAAEQAPQAVAV